MPSGPTIAEGLLEDFLFQQFDRYGRTFYSLLVYTCLAADQYDL